MLLMGAITRPLAFDEDVAVIGVADEVRFPLLKLFAQIVEIAVTRRLEEDVRPRSCLAKTCEHGCRNVAHQHATQHLVVFCHHPQSGPVKIHHFDRHGCSGRSGVFVGFDQ